jgi:PST family polysaccharide transporter
VSEAWPLALSSTAVLVYMRIDQIMLGEMVGDREVGVYGAAIRFSEVWYFIPVSIIVSLAPSLVELRRVNVDLYYERFSNLFRLMMGIALAISIP